MTGEEIRMNEVLLEVKDLRTQFLTERGQEFLSIHG